MIIYANPKMEQMLGYGPGELNGTNVAQLYPPDARGEADRLDVQYDLRTFGESAREITSLRKDGVIIQCRITISTIQHHEHGSVWVAVREDITARKAADDLVRRLAAIVESTFEAVVGKTDSGVIESWNRGAERLYGYTREEATGQDVSLIVPSDLLEEERSLFARVRGGEDVPPFDTLRTRRDGSLVQVSVAVSAIRSASGKLMGISTIAHDISEQKSAREQVERSLREKEVLLKEIHHRVKNNLQVISSLLKLHANKITQPEAQAAFEDSQARVHAIGLLHEKLYESKDLASVDMSAYAQSLVSALVRTHGEGAARVNVDINGGGVYLTADRAVPLGLILNELLTNSFKHAFSPLSVRPAIHVTVRKVDGNCELTVRDNGPGLPARFELNKLNSLGLRLVRMLSRQLSGSLHMESDRGTRSTVTFPECPVEA